MGTSALSLKNCRPDPSSRQRRAARVPNRVARAEGPSTCRLNTGPVDGETTKKRGGGAAAEEPFVLWWHATPSIHNASKHLSATRTQSR